MAIFGNSVDAVGLELHRDFIKIIGEARTMQRWFAVFPSAAGEKVLGFPYSFKAWSRLGQNLATLLMKPILNFIAIIHTN